MAAAGAAMLGSHQSSWRTRGQASGRRALRVPLATRAAPEAGAAGAALFGVEVAFVFGAAARLHEVEDQNAFRRQQLAGRVAAAYWRTVAQQRVVTLLRDDLHAVDAMVDYHRKRVDAGAMKGVDLLRMQIERDRLSLALQAAERDAELAQSILLTQIGERPSASLHLTDAIETTPAIAPISEDVAVAARYDVLVAEDAVRSAEAEVKLQQAYAVPDLDLLAGYKRNSGDDTAYAALQIPLPLRNRNQGEIERTKAALTAAQATLSATRTRATIEIEAAQKYYEQERNIIQQTLPSMQARARENLSITGEAYRIGGIDLLRYIDAERTSFDVEVTALRNLAEFQQAALQLQLAYGIQP